MNSDLFPQINTMSVQERVTLIGELWDSIALNIADSELSDLQKSELDKRISSIENTNTVLHTWDDIKKDVQLNKHAQ